MSTEHVSPTAGHPPALASVVEGNIRQILDERRKEERARTVQEKVADAISHFAGSMLFVYIHLAVYSTWILVNVGWLPGPKFDPSLVILAMAASVEAIFLSTFVLITQNRMAAVADRRADLDLQISLLAEHEVTHLIRLVTAIAERLEVDGADAPELKELAQDVAPEKVMRRMEEEDAKAAGPAEAAR